MTFKCTQCGWCCEYVNINVSYHDILRWAKEARYDILAKIAYIDNEDPRKRGFYIEDTITAPKKPCPFLTAEKLCSIQDTKPRACADFPIAYFEEELDKIECPALPDYEVDFATTNELHKEQAFDFFMAETKKSQLLQILADARDILAMQARVKAFGDDPVEDLYATGFVNNRTGWTRVGTTPYLSSQDQPTNYVWTATKKAEIGDWSFANTARPPTDTINSVTLYVYGQSAGVSGDNTFYIWDGSSWTDAVLPALPNTWNWVSVDLSTLLNTWTKIDAAQLYIAHANTTNRSDVDAARLAVDYTAGAISIPLNVAGITLAGQTLTVVPGAVTIALNTASMTLAGQVITVDAPPTATVIPLNTATVTVSGVAFSVENTYLVNHANWFFSPGNWYINGSSYALTNNPGAYCKFGFYGSGLKLAIDMTLFNALGWSASDYPYLKWRIDGGGWNKQITTSSMTEFVLASALSVTNHTCEVYFESARRNGDRWNNPSVSIRFDSATVADGTLTAPTLATQRWIAFGDSRTEGVNTYGDSYSNAHQGAARNWATLVGEANDAEVGAVGWVSQGYSVPAPAISNVDEFDNTTNQTWDKLFLGQARSFTGIDAIIANCGINDPVSETVEGYVEAFLTEFRAAYPNILIYLVVPFADDEPGSSQMFIDAYNDYQAATPDSKTYLFNINGQDATLDEDLDGDGVFGATYTYDGLHPNQAGHDRIAELLDPYFAATYVFLDKAEITLTGITTTIEVDINVLLSTGTVTVGGQTVTLSMGEMTKLLNTGQLTVNGVVLTVDAGLTGIVIGLDTA